MHGAGQGGDFVLVFLGEFMDLRNFLLAGVFLASVSAAFAFDAEVLSTEGTVEVNRGSGWQNLYVGDRVSEGDKIQTGFKSKAVIQIKGSKVTVSQLSRLTLEELSEKESSDDTKLYCDRGSVRSDVKKSEDRAVNFRVRSPVTTAAVRGTNFVVENTFRGSSVKTNEGVVAVWRGNSDTAPKGSFTVSAGQKSGFSKDRAGAKDTPQTIAARNAELGSPSTTRASFAECAAQVGRGGAPEANPARKNTILNVSVSVVKSN